MVKNQISIILLFIVSLSCDSGHHTRTYHLPKTKVNTFQPSTVERVTQISSFTWEKPTLWIPNEGSSMRLASFEIPYSTGSGDLSIMELGGDGGGLEANVNRWRGQIGLDPLTKLEIKDEAGNGVSQIGNYLLFQLINLEKKESAFLAAVFPLESRTLFIKLTASADGILEIEKDFKDFCSSMKFEISKQ
jgi:hypothetical protein